MSIQQERFFDTRVFRIAVIAVAAIAVLALAAYWFGTGLRADAPASVAPSPLGSSLTAVRASTSEDYVGRLINASEAAKAASLAALAKSRSDFYAELNASAASREGTVGRLISPSAAARLTALAALAKSRADFHAELNASAATARTASSRLSAAEYAAKSGIPAATISRPAALSNLELRRTGFAAAVASPSAGPSTSMIESSTEGQFQWVKPEGIKPSEAANPAAEQDPWIKPEGIRSK